MYDFFQKILLHFTTFLYHETKVYQPIHISLYCPHNLPLNFNDSQEPTHSKSSNTNSHPKPKFTQTQQSPKLINHNQHNCPRRPYAINTPRKTHNPPTIIIELTRSHTHPSSHTPSRHFCPRWP